MKKTLLAGLAIGVLVLFNSQSASAVSWIDWGNTTGIIPGSGTITVGSEVVNATISGLVDNFVDGVYYYDNGNTGGTSPAGTYGGLKPSDMIQEWGTGRVTINFDKAVIDPYIALVSVGQTNVHVSYTFNNPLTPINVVSFGSNYWGYNGYEIDGARFTGDEFNGILQLTGTFNSLAFDITPGEYWHGFNIGVANPVPEPATMLLFGAGIAGLAGMARRKRS